MKKRKQILLDFEIDKLTNSIQNVQTGDSFLTDVSLINSADLKNTIKKTSWKFDWKFEFAQRDREVFKLTIRDNPSIIQGLISLQIHSDHVYMHLIESALFNIGKSKVYVGVPGNLVAYACKLSFQRGGEGYLSFLSKTKLIDHYTKTLGAMHIGNHLMVINTEGAKFLTDKYFQNF